MSTAGPLQPGGPPQGPAPPINIFYSPFHDSIRAELDGLDASVSSLEPARSEQELVSRLQQLKERYGDDKQKLQMATFELY